MLISQSTITFDQPSVRRRARLRIFEPFDGSIGVKGRYLFSRRDQGFRVQFPSSFRGSRSLSDFDEIRGAGHGGRIAIRRGAAMSALVGPEDNPYVNLMLCGRDHSLPIGCTGFARDGSSIGLHRLQEWQKKQVGVAIRSCQTLQATFDGNARRHGGASQPVRAVAPLDNVPEQYFRRTSRKPEMGIIDFDEEGWMVPRDRSFGTLKDAKLATLNVDLDQRHAWPASLVHQPINSYRGHRETLFCEPVIGRIIRIELEKCCSFGFGRGCPDGVD